MSVYVDKAQHHSIGTLGPCGFSRSAVRRIGNYGKWRYASGMPCGLDAAVKGNFAGWTPATADLLRPSLSALSRRAQREATILR